MKRLPRSLDEIGGLRAARWIRESTAGQYDRYGPASQRDQQDRFIERHGLVDTGLVYQVAHSGRTVWRSATMATMVEDLRSGRFDLLLTGYSDRWQRNLRRTLELLEDELHPNGVALVMCDRRILSSDPSDWDELISEAAGAEKYSRRLSERITEGYAAKFDQEHDPGGHAGLGFRRLPEPPHTLEIDPDRMPIAVGLFERYALGNVSATQLEAETGLAATRIRMILMNPLYNGWIRRHRGKDETRRPAPWRAKPPVSDELWARVEEVRRAKTRGGGPKNWDRVDLLGGLLECVCGRQLRNDGTFADGRHRKLHAAPCEAWGRKARLGDETWEGPAGPGRRHRGGRRHHGVRRRGSRVEQAAGRDRPGADRSADPRVGAGARWWPAGRRCVPDAHEGAPRATRRDHGANGYGPSWSTRGRVVASQYRLQTYRRRRQT